MPSSPRSTLVPRVQHNLPAGNSARLSELARFCVYPKLGNDSWWPDVRNQLHLLNWPMDKWQQGIAQVALNRQPDGSLTCAVEGVTVSVCRQAGKTHVFGGIAYALALLRPGTLILWTAHRDTTAAEVFRTMYGISMRPEVAPFIDVAKRGNTDRGIYFKNGSRILFGSRERGFGRGFAKVDMLIFDEGQILSEAAIEDMVPATNVSEIGLVVYCGTPPRPIDKSEVFTRKRQQALDALEDPNPDGTYAVDGAYIEFSADPDADLDDETAWAQANPSFPLRTNKTAIRRMRRNFSDESFTREGLGIWPSASIRSVIPMDDWNECLVETSPDSSVVAYGLDMTSDHSVSIAVAVRHKDERVHVEIAEMGYIEGQDTRAVFAWLSQRAGRKIPVVMYGHGVTGSLVPAANSHGLHVQAINSSDMAKACQGLLTAVTEHRVTHIGQEPLDVAVLGAEKKAIGNMGGWGWDVRSNGVNVSPLVAVTCALYGAATGSSSNKSKGKVW